MTATVVKGKTGEAPAFELRVGVAGCMAGLAVRFAATVAPTASLRAAAPTLDANNTMDAVALTAARGLRAGVATHPELGSLCRQHFGHREPRLSPGSFDFILNRLAPIRL